MELPKGHKRYVIEGFADRSGRYYINPVSFHSYAVAKGVADHGNAPRKSGRLPPVFWSVLDTQPNADPA